MLESKQPEILALKLDRLVILSWYQSKQLVAADQVLQGLWDLPSQKTNLLSCQARLCFSPEVQSQLQRARFNEIFKTRKSKGFEIYVPLDCIQSNLG